VGGDDHKLIRGLTGGKFSLQPVPPRRVKKAMSVNIVRAVGFRLGIIGLAPRTRIP
jgi:hypothetical protein